MSIETQKLNLIERLMKVKQPVILNEFEKILQRAEIEERIVDSFVDEAKGNVVSLNQFAKNNRDWLQEQRTK